MNILHRQAILTAKKQDPDLLPMDKEARERGITTVKPEVVKPEGGDRRNWTGKTPPRGLTSLSNNDGKPLPRYLQTSIKSCHDFCKYGRRHDFEGKEKHPFLRRLRHNIVTAEGQNEAKTLDFGDRGKRPASKLKASPVQRIEFSDKPKAIKHKALLATKGPEMLEKPVNKKSQILSPGQKDILSGKQSILPTTPENEQIRLKGLNTCDSKERGMIKRMTPPQSKTFLNKPKVLKQKNLSHGNEVDAHGKHGPMKEKTVLSAKKGISSMKPKLLKQISVKKPATAAKLVIVKQRASMPPKSIGVSAKPEVSLKAKKTPKVKSASLLTPAAGLASRRNREDKTSKSLGMSKVGEGKVLKPSTASLPAKSANDASNLQLRKYSEAKLRTPVKGQENVEKTAHDSGEKVEKAELDIDGNEEKTLYVIEPKVENADVNFMQQISDGHHTLESVSHDEEEVKEPESASRTSKSSESLFDDEGTESYSSDELSNGEDRRKPRRTATVHREDNTPAPYRLKFRRGTVIEPQPDSNGPRRLIFRRRRVVGENTNGHPLVGRRSFRRRYGMDVSKDPNSKAQGVVLRHQDKQGKKETQSLFNNVIEETASKLAETRKSKVKALVGAFETVISLQDSNPASSA